MRYSGLPDEDLDEKIAQFRASLELTRITEEEDKVTALPFLLEGQAATTFRKHIKKNVQTLDDAIKMLKDTFLSEEARRANDNI